MLILQAGATAVVVASFPSIAAAICISPNATIHFPPTPAGPITHLPPTAPIPQLPATAAERDTPPIDQHGARTCQMLI
ncbi:unnamed protein product, partial [Closterium sp. Naga37s-1]